jgi:serine/threonine protein kinase
LYYSPEIVSGAEYDEKIDLWDIGMMTYECLLGKVPFKVYTEMDLNRIVTDEVTFPSYVDTTDEAQDFILKILQKKPEDRMTVREMLRHPFITKYAEKKLPLEVMTDIQSVLK